jgi:fused signal recognition particle receptor
MGLLDTLGLKKLKDGLAKTRSQLADRVTRLVVAKGSIDDELLDQLEDILIASDVGVSAAADIIEAVKLHVKEQRYVDNAELNRLLKDAIRQQFIQVGGDSRSSIDDASQRTPYVIMVVGVNGVGKTTTIGKLAHRYVAEGKNVLIAAADTFRAAANEQLQIWSRRAGAHMIHQRQGSDPAAVAFDALQAAASRKSDIVIVDTAGRLHTKTNLMEELKKISRVMKKLDPSAPHEVLLVIDASTGQNGLQQARQFAAAAGVTGLVLTKLDGTAKGGIVLAITRDLKIPVQYVGLGEQIGDLQPFDDEAFVNALFDQES